MTNQYLSDLSGKETYIQERHLLKGQMPLTDLTKQAFLDWYMGELAKSRPDWFIDGEFKGDSYAERVKGLFFDFVNKGENGDMVAEFDTFPFAPILSGRAGFVILRGNKVVATNIQRMS